MECESNARIGIFCITIEYKSSCHTFSNILQKFNKLPFLGTLDMSGYFHQKLIIQLLEVLILMNFKMNSIHNFFLGYCKDIANLLHWVLWECLIIPITIPSTFSGSSYHIVENFDTQSVEINCWETLIFICIKKVNFISNVFRDIVKTLQTCFFGNFGDAWPYPSKNLSINL